MAFAAPPEEIEGTKSKGFSAPASEVEGFSAPGHELDATSIADPVEHAAANYDNPAEKEAAFNVYKQQAKQPSDMMGGTGRFLKSVGTTIFPTPDQNGQWHWPLVSGAVNLAKGVVQTGQNIMDTTGAPGSLNRTLSGLTGPILPAVENFWNEDPTAERAGRQLAAGTQEGMLNATQMMGNLRHNISAAAGTITGGAIGANQSQLSDDELRQRFDDEAHYRYLSKQVQKGILPSEAESGQMHGLTPEQLAVQGKPVNPEEIQNISTATNPANLVEIGAITNPIARGVMAPLVKGAGGILTGAANLADKIHINPVARTMGAAEMMFHGQPLAAAGAMAAPVLSKGAAALTRGAGDILAGAGDEMAGGQIPLGQSAVTKVLKEGIKGAAGAVPTAAAFAATGATPEEAGQQFGNAIGLGGILSAASAVPKSGASGAIERTAAGQQLASEGAAANYGTGFDAWHQEGMQSVSPQDANEINKYRGFLGRLRTPDGKPIQVYAVKGDKFAQVQKGLGEVDAQGNPTNPNGRGLISPDGSQIFVNTDAQGDVSGPLGHETGHAADLVAKYADTLLHQSLQSSIAQHLYSQDGNGNVIPTKEFSDFMDNYQKAVGAKQMTRQDFESEFVAETARRILSGQGIENFTLPKSLGEKLKDGASDFLGTLGIKPEDGKLGFGGKEVQAITRNVSDLLRQPTQEAAPTSAQYRIDQLKTTLANPPGKGATIEQLDQFAAAKKEYNDLLKKQDFNIPSEFPASGKAPVPPSAPSVPVPQSGMGDIPRVAAALRLNGLSATEALQWASAAQGKDVSEKVIDALKQRANQKFPNASPTPNEPVPAQPSASQSASPTTTETATETQPAVAVAAKPAPSVKTAEQVKAMVDAAEAQALQKEKRPDTKAAKQRVVEAKMNVLLDDIGDENGLHRVTDEFGNTSITGDYDPSDPRQKALADLGGITPEQEAKIQEVQGQKGKVTYLRYRGALSGAENAESPTRDNIETGMENRKAEYAVDPASEREEGTVHHKAVIPLETSLSTKSGSMTSRAIVLDNLLHNIASIFEELPKGRENPYGTDPKEQGPLIAKDAQAYAQNHAHGYKGDGSGPIKQFPDSGLPSVDANYTPEQIPADRFAILNMALGSESAAKLAELNDKVSQYQAKGKDVPKSIAARKAIAQEAYALSKENGTWNDETGETNQLRAEMKAAGFDIADRLSPVIQTLSPQHILETSENPIPLRDGDIPSVRPSGIDIDPAELGSKGTPNRKAAAAGFLPAEVDAEGKAKYKNERDPITGTQSLIRGSAVDETTAGRISAINRERMAAAERAIGGLRRGDADSQSLWDSSFASPRSVSSRGEVDFPSKEAATKFASEDPDNRTAHPPDPAWGDLAKWTVKGKWDRLVDGSIEFLARSLGVPVIDTDSWNKLDGMKTLGSGSEGIAKKDEAQGAAYKIYQRRADGSLGLKSVFAVDPTREQSVEVRRARGDAIDVAQKAAILSHLGMPTEIVGIDRSGSFVTKQPLSTKGNKNNLKLNLEKSGAVEIPWTGDVNPNGEDTFMVRVNGEPFLVNDIIEDRNSGRSNAGDSRPMDAVVGKVSPEAMTASKTLQDAFKKAKELTGSAAFLPTESTPEGEPTAPKEAGQPQAGSLNPLGASGEDSNKPEDGATPAERLAREAEEDGVMLSMATIRAMIRNDPETMNKIRARIETATGKPAKFLPAEKYDPSQDNTPIVNEGQPAWITRFERLWNKELSGGLTKDEEDAVDAYHQKAIRVFGSLSNYEKLQKEGRIAEFLKAKAE